MTKISYKIGILLTFLIGFFLRLYHLEFLNLWRDEAFSVNVAKFPFVEVIRTSALDTQPPLHLLILHFWMKIFSDGEFSVRFLSLIFGMITILFVFLISKIIFKKKSYVILTTLLACVNPLLIVYSQEARSYSMLTAFSTAAVFFTLNLNKNGKSYNYLGFILSSILGLYTHNIFVVVLAAIFLFRIAEFLFSKKIKIGEIVLLKNAYVRKILLSYILIFIAYIPWLIIFIGQYSKINSEGFWLPFEPFHDPIKNYPWFFTSVSYGNDFSIIDWITFVTIRMLAIPLTFIGIFYEITKFKKQIPKISILTLLMFLIVYVISFKTAFFYVRYIIFITPLLIILVSIGLTFLEKKIKFAFVIGIIIAICSTIFYISNISQFVSKTEYKKALSEISFEKETDIILQPHAATFHGVNYYSDLPNFIYDPPRDIDYFEGLAYIKEENYFDGNLLDYKRVWVINYWRDPDLDNKLTELGFRRAQISNYNVELYVELWVFEKEQELAQNNL